MENLDLLENQAAALDAETAAQGPEAQAAQAEAAEAMALVDQNQQACGMLLALAGQTFGIVGFPSVASVLTEDKRAALAAVWAPVLTKYGVNLGDLGGAYKEEIAAVVVTLPIGLAIARAIKHDADARAKAIEPPGDQAPAANEADQAAAA